MELSLRQLAYANDHCQKQGLISDVFLPVGIDVFTPEGRPSAVVKSSPVVKRFWIRTSLSTLHFIGVKLGSYNPFLDPTLYGSVYALGLFFYRRLHTGHQAQDT
jgi:hypothetical protein